MDIELGPIIPGRPKVFHPTDFAWQTRVASKFGMTEIMQSFVPTQMNKMKLSTKTVPTKLQFIKGDGNCFYRAISFLVSGSQENHGTVRQCVGNYMEELADIIKLRGLVDEDDFAKKKENMLTPHFWATEVDIFVTAALLDTDIYTCHKHGQEMLWSIHCPEFLNPNGTSGKEAIYINHTNGNHYDAILQVGTVPGEPTYAAVLTRSYPHINSSKEYKKQSKPTPATQPTLFDWITVSSQKKTKMTRDNQTKLTTAGHETEPGISTNKDTSLIIDQGPSGHLSIPDSQTREKQISKPVTDQTDFANEINWSQTDIMDIDIQIAGHKTDPNIPTNKTTSLITDQGPSGHLSIPDSQMRQEQICEPIIDQADFANEINWPQTYIQFHIEDELIGNQEDASLFPMDSTSVDQHNHDVYATEEPQDGNTICKQLTCEIDLNPIEAEEKLRSLKSPENSLPYPEVSDQFYLQLGKNAVANENRNLSRDNAVIIHVGDESGKPLFVKRLSKTFGSLCDEVRILCKTYKQELNKDRRAHLFAVSQAGQFLLENGPLVKTQAMSDVFMRAKEEYLNFSKKFKRKRSINLLETLSKCLPVMQIYIHGTGYLMEQQECGVQNFVDTIRDSVNVRQQANEILSAVLGDTARYMKLLDTELDKSVVKALLVELYSLNSVSRLKGFNDKKSLQRARDEIPTKTTQLEKLAQVLLPVRSDMTVQQQHYYHKRLVNKQKTKLLRYRAAGAGRELYCDKFPELASVLELAFGDRAKSHPRLTTDTMYRGKDSAFTMPAARQILLMVAPSEVKNISLSTCYTYTENYKSGTYQAKRHHEGRGLNAKISLHNVPRIGIVEDRVNNHYCRANVNHYLNCAADNPVNCMVDCKDAKGIVCADIDPVQNMGKSWKKIKRLDHEWDQSRRNACTPMTHLFLETKQEDAIVATDNVRVQNITRSGQAVTLVNMSFYEGETVHRCFNEIFHLLTIPSLDSFFRNPENGKLRKVWVFVVDNGPSEAPASFMVRMLLVRLLKFLKLLKVTQVSYEAMNSKDNPAERPHAAENLALSRHGPFPSSTFPHQKPKVGSAEHQENMESMATQVINCLNTAQFGGRQLLSFRGVGDRFLFNDEEELRTFLKLSEQGKDESRLKYQPCNAELLADLDVLWEVDGNFSGSYLADYQHLFNAVHDDQRTAWLTNYVATVYTEDLSVLTLERFERQPVPDFLRWLSDDGELHYLSHEMRLAIPEGPWDEEALFQPSVLIGCIDGLNTTPPQSIVPYLALLSWVPENKLQEELQRRSDHNKRVLNDDKERDRWNSHELFSKSVVELRECCKTEGMNYFENCNKIELVQLLAVKRSIDPPAENVYDGQLHNLPMDLSNLSNISIGYLRQILEYHNLSSSGKKEELVLRVFLLRHGRSALVLRRILNHLRKPVLAAMKLIIEQRKLSGTVLLQIRKRKHASSTVNAPREKASLPKTEATKSKIPVPQYVTEKNIHDIFQPLLDWFDQIEATQSQIDSSRIVKHDGTASTDKIDIFQQCQETGACVKVLWDRSEIGNSGWSVGWYNANVLSYDVDTDLLELEYAKEPGCVYSIELKTYLASGKLRLVRSVFCAKNNST